MRSHYPRTGHRLGQSWATRLTELLQMWRIYPVRGPPWVTRLAELLQMRGQPWVTRLAELLRQKRLSVLRI